MKVGIKNNGKGSRHFHQKQTGKRLTLKPGMNEVDADLVDVFQSQIESDGDLQIAQAINDVPVKQEESSKEPENTPPAKVEEPTKPTDPDPAPEETAKDTKSESKSKVKVKPAFKNTGAGE